MSNENMKNAQKNLNEEFDSRRLPFIETLGVER
jgi:hypothetical protein